jgi:hypothetical protein
MIDLFKKPKKPSWFTGIKILWAIIFAKLYYWWTGKIRIQWITQPDEVYGAVKCADTDEIVRAYKLPAKFRTNGFACFGVHTVFDCSPLVCDDGVLEWVDLNHITVMDKQYTLHSPPKQVLVQVSNEGELTIPQDKLFHPDAEERIRFEVIDS